MTAKAETYSNGQHENSASAVMKDAKDALEDGITDARDAMDEFAREANKEVRKVTEQATTFVKDNPGMALLGAVGVGVLVGLAMRSR